jgi:hypothetical protein
MPSAWITHVKNYASKNNINYSSALKDPKCSQSYKMKVGTGNTCRRAIGRSSGNVRPEDYADVLPDGSRGRLAPNRQTNQVIPIGEIDFNAPNEIIGLQDIINSGIPLAPVITRQPQQTEALPLIPPIAVINTNNIPYREIREISFEMRAYRDLYRESINDRDKNFYYKKFKSLHNKLQNLVKPIILIPYARLINSNEPILPINSATPI